MRAARCALRNGAPRRALTALLLLVLALGCRGDRSDAAGDGAPGPDAIPARRAPFVIETVAAGLEVPWSLGFAPDGRIFVTERPGRIRVIEGGTLREAPWAALPVNAIGEAGLMGLALAPDFATSRHVFVVGTFEANGTLINRVVRLTDRDGRGSDPVVIVDALPAARFHAGDAIAFGPDGMLYVATGDARDPGAAQDPRSLAGKLLRYRPDGAVPADNPAPGSPVFALGLRNVQGLAWHPRSRELFVVDHGPSGFPNERLRRNRDELNAIRAGANYGWPAASGRDERPEFAPPVVEWSPAIAPGGMTFYTGRALPWYGDALVGGLRGAQLRRVVLEPAPQTRTGWRAIADSAVVTGLGRIRAVAMGPDGQVYITTSNRDGRGNPDPRDDRVLRLVAR